jgi:hypothetical protein
MENEKGGKVLESLCDDCKKAEDCRAWHVVFCPEYESKEVITVNSGGEQ